MQFIHISGSGAIDMFLKVTGMRGLHLDDLGKALGHPIAR